jgi:glutathione S-transferase
MMLSLLLLTFVVSCDGLASPLDGFLSKLQGPGGNSRPAAPLSKEAAELLTSLDMSSPTEPVLAGIRSGNLLNILTASVPLVLRAASGVFAQDYEMRLVEKNDEKYTYAAYDNQQLEETGVFKVPNEPIILYEFEACPFCRKVREACSMLSLSVTFRPTPSNGPRFRPEIKTKYGAKASFPFMKDPNTGVEMFESDDIISYLFKVYGNGQVPWTLKQGSPIVPLTAGLGVSLARMGAGGSYRDSNPPANPLVLWAYEGSPFCKVVRENLCALEIPHTVMFSPRGSYNRQRLWEKAGRFQVPWLEDPNTGVNLFESEAINEYIEKQYGVAQTPVKYL